MRAGPAGQRDQVGGLVGVGGRGAWVAAVATAGKVAWGRVGSGPRCEHTQAICLRVAQDGLLFSFCSLFFAFFVLCSFYSFQKVCIYDACEGISDKINKTACDGLPRPSLLYQLDFEFSGLSPEPEACVRV